MNYNGYFEESFLSTDFYKSIIDRMMNAFALHKVVFDDEGMPCDYVFIDVNPNFVRITGLEKSSIIGRKVSEVIPNIREDKVKWIDIYGNVAISGESISFESYSPALGKWYTINAYSPKKDYFITVFNDICQIKSNESNLKQKNEELLKAQENLKYLATHDYLTRLPNRASLLEDVNSRIEKYPGTKFALLYIEIDSYKVINSTLGHILGERFVTEIGKRLTALFRSRIELYRLDGADFIICFNGFQHDDEVTELTDRIIQYFEKPFSLEENRLFVTVNIGISIFPDHASRTDELIQNANIAVHHASKEGINKIAFYRKEMQDALNERLIIERHLLTALDNHEFQIHYQPQLDLITRKVCGYEALLRWRNPEIGSIPPDAFIGIAEANHLIIPIGKWVLRNACYFIKKLQMKGFTDFVVAVNVSIIQLMQDDFVDSVLQIIDLIDLEPRYLELEITESIFVKSYDVVHEKLECLRKRGVIIALDDFGKGYSSLSGLQNLPIDILKVDKVFIDSIVDQERHRCITDMIIMLGRKMGMTVLAEGVETQEQMDYLVQNKCDRMQGYLYSKPLPEKEITDKLIYTKAPADRNIYGFEWKDEYRTHVDAIDDQHKKMFEIGNQLSKLVFSEDNIDDKQLLVILRELRDYLEFHFSFEESYMLSHGILSFETHKNKHNEFMLKVNKLFLDYDNCNVKDFCMFLIDLLSAWIIRHILKEDMKLKNQG